MLIKGLYDIESFSHESGQVEATIRLNPEHAIFEGHFPGNPVMPGVCMLQILKEFCEKATNQPLFLRKSSQVKFMSIINPNRDKLVHITMQIQESDDEIKLKAEARTDLAAALKMRSTFTRLPK